MLENKGSPMFIRPATPSDSDNISSLHVDATRHGYQNFADASYLAQLDQDITPAKWAEWLNDSTHALIAFTDDSEAQATGFISFGPIRTRIKEDRGIMPSWPGEIYGLYLHPDHWGNGIAQALMRAITDPMRKNYWDKALLWVIDKNKRAVSFYEQMGGQRVGKQQADIGGKTVTELAFGWKDITRIK